MPFHVEIRGSFQRGWAFNLDEAQLRVTILDPWRGGREVVLGGTRWNPPESRLRVLEGPRIEPAELAHGRGWRHAERTARDVTADLLGAGGGDAAVSVAILAETQATGDVAAAALEQLGFVAVPWGPVRSRILAGAAVAGDARRALGVAGALLVSGAGGAGPAWLFDAGLAMGALGSRAVLAVVGDEPAAPPLSELGAIRLEPGHPDALRALGARLGAG